MKLFEIKKRVFCGGFQKCIQGKWQYVDASEIYITPVIVFSRRSKNICIRFLVYELWFRYQNESKVEKAPF